MKKEDREENMWIMFEKCMEHIWLCSIHFSNMICILICIIFFFDICVKKLNKISCYNLKSLFVYLCVILRRR